MPSDINRKPPPYDVEPQYYEGRPDEYVVESEGSDDFDKNAHIAKVLALSLIHISEPTRPY